MENLIEVKNIKKYFPIGGSKMAPARIKYLHAVDNVSFSIKKGEIFGIVGESGSGKSTIGRCALQLLDIDEGEVYFENKRIDHLTNRELKFYRRDMQMVFQNPLSSFNPKKTIGSAFRELGYVYKENKVDLEKRIRELIRFINLPEDVLNRTPNQLSGGQLQRLAIARALLLRPKFILADEPVSALDVSVQAQILNLIIDLKEELGMTMLFISHDLAVVEHVCDVVAVVYLGMIVEMAETKELFSNIMHPYTQALMSAKPKSHPLEEKQRIILEGDVPSAVDVKEGCRFSNRCPRFRAGECDQATPALYEETPGHWVACHFPIKKE